MAACSTVIQYWQMAHVLRIAFLLPGVFLRGVNDLHANNKLSAIRTAKTLDGKEKWKLDEKRTI